MLRFVSTCLAIAITAVAGAAPAEIILAERTAKPSHVIVIPARPDPSERFAAEELREHVRLMTGVELDVTGAADAVAGPAIRLQSGREGTDGFSIRCEGRDVIIRGDCPRGTLYGVYDLLERFGDCSWYAPWRTVVPQRDRFAVPADVAIVEKPSFAWRQPSWYGVRTNRLFAARCRLNAESPDGAVRHPDPKFGGYARRYVDGLYSSHTYYVLLPPERHFNEHPEWFSMVGGKRLEIRGQLCTSNPEVIEAAASRALEMAANDPGAKVLGVSQMDWGGACECDRCRAILEEEGSRAGPALRFVNAIAERVGRVRPDLTVETLIYSYTIDPPKHVRPRQNVMLCCCVDGDPRESFADPVLPANRKWKNAFEFWTSCCQDITVWDYTPCFHWACDPYPNLRVLGPNMRYYLSRGASGIYMDGQPNPGADFGDLKCWMLAKLAWNANSPCEELLDRFLKGCYGAAAPFVRQIIEEQYKALDAHPEFKLVFAARDAPEVFSDAFVARSLDLWNRAEQAVENDEGARFAVRIGKYPAVVLHCLRAARRACPYRVTRQLGRHCLTGPDRAALADERSIRTEAAARGIVLRHSHSRGRDRHLALLIEKLRQMKEDAAPADRLMVGADDFEMRIGDFSGGVWNEKGTVRIVDDPTALSGRAVVETAGSSSAMTAAFHLQYLARDSKPFRVRVRLKADRLAGADGEVARLTVRDERQRKCAKERSVRASELGDGWTWIDFGEVVPQDGRDIEILSATPGSPRVARSFAIDSVEFTRCGK